MYRRIRSDDLGRLEASPTRFPAGSRQMFVLRYVAGAVPVGTGGRVRLMTPRRSPAAAGTSTPCA